MSQSFVQRWFGRRSKPAPSAAEAIADLERLAQDQPSLGRHALLLAEALPVICAEFAMGADWQLPADRIAAKWSGGVPLLRGESLPIDAPEFLQRWLTLCDILAGQIEKQSARALAKALQQQDLSVPELTGWALGGQGAELRARADAIGIDGELAAIVLRWTLSPLFTQLQESMAVRFPSEPWPHGYCPVCGSWPLLSEFRGLEQVRFLRCGGCAAAWAFPRLRCPYCDTTDHRQLGYLHSDGDEGKRAATCDACQGYVKTVTALTPLPLPRLLVADVATLHLDLIAMERGYARP